MRNNSLETGSRPSGEQQMDHARGHDGAMRTVPRLDLTNSSEGRASRQASTFGVVYEHAPVADAVRPQSDTAQYLESIAAAGVRLGSPRRGFRNESPRTRRGGR